MATFTLVLVMLLLVAASGFISRMLPFAVPLPLIQIALGAVVAMSSPYHMELKPEIFFLLFLPPLLFLDGWRIPKVGLFRDAGTILELSLGLVIFTVVGMGFFIHWMIPTMPLPVAFALAAVVSPTDPISVSAIAARVPIPKRIMHVLEGESLLNDATGLVCLRFAVAAALTGTFSVMNAAGTFLWLSIGGIAIGVGLTLGVVWVKNAMARRWGEESGTQILISLLIPFGAYLAAEHMHCSGILSAVAAGITMSYAEASGKALAITRVRRNAVWDSLYFSLNGLIFVLLGEQLPRLFEGASQVVHEADQHETWWLAVYVVAITLGLAALRFVWVWVSVRFTMLRAAYRKQQAPDVPWRMIAVMSLAGVRGTITLAGVLTLPLVMNDGTPFPARDLAIFLAAGVIVLSLSAASFCLPRLIRGMELPPEDTHDAEEDIARIAAAKAAINAIEVAYHDMAEGQPDADLYAATAARLMDFYRNQIDNRFKSGEEKDIILRGEVIERRLRLAGLKAARDAVFELARKRQIDDEVMRKLVREIDLTEARYSGA